MSIPVETLEPFRADGPRRFSRWDAALFDAIAAGPAAVLAGQFDSQSGAAAVLDGYLRLVQEGVGGGALTRSAPGPTGWSSFLERLLLAVVPEQLGEVPAKKRLRVLVETWNLGEGLLREPAWVDRYVNACATTHPRLEELESFLVRTLTPALTPAPPANWTGTMTVSVIDLRPIHAELLPGRMFLAAPTVLCVEDRRRPGLQVGLFLRRRQPSEPLGVVSGLVEYADGDGLPKVAFADGRVTVGGRGAELPALRRCHSFAVARAGFVAASAVDSQRLWLIESD